jgi:glycerophosphoryl diester phosphodiesterase
MVEIEMSCSPTGFPRARMPLVCAHRGRSGLLPENTMPAFEAAVALGADFIELDVRCTSDGEIVCIHDDTVDRTTSGAGKVAEMTLQQIQALDAGTWKGAEFAGTRIPTLREVLLHIAPRMAIHIEIKQRATAKQILELVRETDTLRRVAFISFSADELRAAKTAEPATACGLIVSGLSEQGTRGEQALIASALECGANFISCGRRAITPSLVRECHLAGLSLMAWTMDSVEELQRAIDVGADALVSNFPEIALQILGR